MATKSKVYPVLPSILATIPLILATTFAQKVDPTPENVSKGQELYKKNCLVCHGATGLGDGPAGKRLNPKPTSFQDKEKMSKTDEQLIEEITKGKGSMPAFERKLKESERWMVLHYIRTLAK